MTEGHGSKYVALVRGINVGRNKRVSMADLRDLLVSLGNADVKTHLQSGNAVFTSRKANPAGLETEIEKGFRNTLGLTIRCLVRTGADLRAVIGGNPFQTEATDGSRMLALFLSQPLDPTLLATLDPRALGADKIRLGERVVYQWCPDGILAAPNVGAYVEKYLKVAVTARNWNTVTRLGELLDEA
ncbi:MAG TPA: DUF1697 domain-containing protein [Candidatus Dormibacteraeota bacterium]|nr:DUF1697 domain-containing protein [Candidatus Dormibacteraeota bacterium]